MFTICVLISCAHVCVDTKIKEDGTIEIGEHRIVGYDQECLNMMLDNKDVSN